MRRLLVLLLALGPLAVGAQETAPIGSQTRIHLGAGLGPGVGGVAFTTSPVFDVFTREAVLYADYVPRVTGGSGRLLTSVGVGAGVRLVRAYEIVQNHDPGRLDIALGIRIGPSFYTAFFEQSAESKSRAFSVMLDPFARGTIRVASGRVLFAEVGTQAPALRAGLSTSIGR